MNPTEIEDSAMHKTALNTETEPRACGRRLRGYAAVRDHEGNTHSFGPDDDVPEWAAQQITNPSLWANDGDDDEPVEAP